MSTEVIFIKIQLALAVIFLLYKFLFSVGTRLQARRFFLLAALPVAFLHPFLQMIGAGSKLAGAQVLDTFIVQTVAQTTANLRQNVSWALGEWVYVLIAAVLFLVFVIRLVRLILFISLNNSVSANGYQYMEVDKKISPASFFRFVFLPKGLDSSTHSIILAHERVHVRQWHSLDVLLYEIARIICWINPFIYLLEKELKLVHEYLADEQAGQAEPVLYTNTLLAFNLGIEPSVLTNNFYQPSNLKKRIMMLQQSFSLKSTMWRIAFVLPLLSGFLFLSTTQAQSSEETYKVVEKMPEYKGGKEKMYEYMATNITYPDSEKKKGVEGKVFIRFLVETDGSVSQVEVIKSVSSALDAEALRVVKGMPAWTPGEHNGVPVKVEMVLPIMFAMPAEKAAEE
jgi:TonB family protein